MYMSVYNKAMLSYTCMYIIIIKFCLGVYSSCDEAMAGQQQDTITTYIKIGLL